MNNDLKDFIIEYNSSYYIKIKNINYQYGGSLEQLNNILDKYNKHNVKIDYYDISEAKIFYYTIDNKNICMSLILDYKNNFATIGELRKWTNCIADQDINLIQTLINFSAEIARQSNMTHLELSDRAYHTCDKTSRTTRTFVLAEANTLTTGIPYYYKYGFRYKHNDVHKSVKKNYKKLKMLTCELKYEKLRNKLMNYSNIDIELIDNIYINNLENKVTEFFNDIKYTNCELFSLIYTTLWDFLHLKAIIDKKMILYL